MVSSRPKKKRRISTGRRSTKGSSSRPKLSRRSRNYVDQRKQKTVNDTRPNGILKGEPPDKVQPVFVESQSGRDYILEDEIDREKDIVCGQGNEDNGMKCWCDKVDTARDDVNESNIEEIAEGIVDDVINAGGKFVDHHKPKGKGEKKMWFKMDKIGAVALTVKALRRIPVQDFDKNNDVVMGRGGGGNNNPGNKVYRGAIDAEVNEHERESAFKYGENKNISQSIIQGIYDRGGRFVTDENSVKGRFYLVSSKEKPVGEREIIKKVSQCLREKMKKKQTG